MVSDGVSKSDLLQIALQSPVFVMVLITPNYRGMGAPMGSTMVPLGSELVIIVPI